MKVTFAILLIVSIGLLVTEPAYSCSKNEMLNVVLFGATGATGRAMVDLLVGGRYAGEYVNHSAAIAPDSEAAKTVRHITAMTRKESLWAVVEEPAHPFGQWQLANHVMDFEKMDETLAPKLAELQKTQGNIDVVFCAHGTTAKQAGSDEAFIHIDREQVVEMARQAKAAGVKHFSLVSSVGADPTSSFLYTRTKGQTIDDIKALGFERFSVFKPGLLITREGRNDSRLGESIFQQVSPFLNWVSKSTGWGFMKAAESITVEDLAASMIANAMRPSPTTTGYEEYNTSPDVISLTHRTNF